MEIAETTLEELGFTKEFENEYAEVHEDKKRRIVTCILKTDYVPIKDFRELFNNISKLIRNKDINKFIFDKRALRTFHQPSMEWYFIDWKVEMFEHGLVTHRKILPNLAWFAKAVEIARKPLMEKFPDHVKSSIDIGYRNSLEEAVNS